MFDLLIDSDLFDRASDLVGATDSQLEKARVSALRLMRKTIRATILKEVSVEERITQKSLGGRIFFSSVEEGDDELEVWIGTWDISPFAIGNPKQNSRGVRSGQRSYPGAFLGSVYTAEQKVWIRLYSEHYTPDLYPTDYRPGDRGIGSNRGRFPVVRAAIPIDHIVKRVMESNQGYFARQFEKKFIQQLNYQVNVKGSRA